MGFHENARRKRAAFGFSAVFFMAGAILLMILVLVAGTTRGHPEEVIYFLQVDTSSIPGAPATTRWTLWNACAVDANGDSLCGPSHADYPFDPVQNFNTTVNIPKDFQNTDHYFLTSRFLFPFMVISLFFAVCSLFLGLIAMFTRIISWLCFGLSFLAGVFETITTSLMTAVYVQGRNAFEDSGHPSHLGQKAFGFMWAAVACMFLSILFFGLGGGLGTKREKGYNGRKHRRRGFFNFQRSGSVRSRTKDSTENA